MAEHWNVEPCRGLVGKRALFHPFACETQYPRFQGSQSHLNWESTGLIACMCGNGPLKLFLVVFIVIERLH